MKKSKKLVAVFLAALTLVVASACSTRAPSEYIMLYYTAGPGEDRGFLECIQPSSSGSYPIDDELFSIPVSLRTWNISREGGDSATPIKTGTKPVDGRPGVDVNIFATIDFFVNTDCEGGKDSPVVKFWEASGRRYGIAVDADDESGFQVNGWKTLLQNTVVPAEEKAVRETSRGFTADELDANLNVSWTKMEKAMAPFFQREVRAKVGGDYFCGPGFKRNSDGTIQTVEWVEQEATGELDANGIPIVRDVKKSGKCPPVRISITDVELSDGDVAKARAGVYAAELKAREDLIKAQSQVAVAKELSKVSDNPNYLKLRELEIQREIAEMQLRAAEKCSANPQCTVVAGVGNVSVGTK